MKKPLVLVFGFTFIVLFLTGCTSEKTRTTILSKLSSSGIIEDGWEYIDSDTTSAAPIPGISSYEYYYQDASGNIYEISISGSQTETDQNEKYYPIYISNHMAAREKTETYTDPETKESKERPETDYYQTDETVTASYRMYKHKFLFWSFWELQKEEG